MRTAVTEARRCLMLLLLCAAVSATAIAQGVTSAAIYGKVTDNAGNALPGANIVATHVPSGSIYGTTSRDNGDYNIPSLRVGGPYTVTVTFVGFAKKEYKDIYLQLSQNLRQDIRVAEEAVRAGEVLVTAERSAVLSASHTGANTNVVREQIDRLPSIARNFQDYYKLSPYFNPTSTSNSGSSGNALGRNSKYNNIQIDGTNYNDLFGLGSSGAPAGQSTVTPISLDALEEFQINVSPFDVRQAGFTGAGINAVTRSGTNDYKGSVFYFGRNQGFVGGSPDSLKAKLANFTDNQYGGRVGGPIIENRLFFFANAEITRFSQPFTRTFGNAQIGTNAHTVSADSLTQLSNYLKAKYGYNPGSFSDIGYNRESDKIFLRFDFNINESNRLTARWNYLRSSEDNSPSRGRNLTDIYFDNAKYKLDDKTHSVALQLSSVLSNSMSNEFILGYVDQGDIPTYYGSAFPTVYIQTPTAGGNEIVDIGAEEFRHHNELGQKYTEITDNFTYYMGDHTFTLGAKIDMFKFRNLFISDAFGAYSYSSIARFMSGAAPDANLNGVNKYSLRYSATSNPLQEANWGANQIGLYVQDEWNLMPRLKVTAGLRVDIPSYPEGPNENKTVAAVFNLHTSSAPKTTPGYSPRLGFNYSVDEDRTTQVRGGLGVFYGRFPFVWVSNQYSNTGVDFYTYTTAPAAFNADPNGQVKPAAGTFPTAEVDLTKSNFKAPSIIRYNLGVDHKLPYDFVASVEGIFSTTQNDVYYKNINIAGQQDAINGFLPGRPSITAGGVIAGEGRPVYGKYDTTTFSFSYTKVSNAFTNVYLVTNTTQGSNANVVVQLQRSVADGISGIAAYTWGLAKDVSSGNSTTAGSGFGFNPVSGDPNKPVLAFSQWDRTHRILGSVSYRYDWGQNGLATTVGVFYNGQSGRPFSYFVSGDMNGDGQASNDLAYIPKDANDIILVTSTRVVLPKTDAAYTTLDAFINNDSYLKDHRGGFVERNGPREPWVHQIDMRLNQEVQVMPGHKLEITLDVLNVLNLLKSDWGWVRNTGVNQTVAMYTFKGLNKTAGADYGKPLYQLQTTTVKLDKDGNADPFVPDNILSRWQLQLGARYTL